MQKSGIDNQELLIKPQQFAERIRLALFMSRIPVDDFCKMIGMKKSTYYSRLHDPNSFRLEEVQLIYHVLNLYEEDPLNIKCLT